MVFGSPLGWSLKGSRKKGNDFRGGPKNSSGEEQMLKVWPGGVIMGVLLLELLEVLVGSIEDTGLSLAAGQNQWYHFGPGVHHCLVHFSWDWDVHWG